MHNGCPGGRVFAPFKSCLGGGMVLDEMDTCIRKKPTCSEKTEDQEKNFTQRETVIKVF